MDKDKIITRLMQAAAIAILVGLAALGAWGGHHLFGVLGALFGFLILPAVAAFGYLVLLLRDNY